MIITIRRKLDKKRSSRKRRGIKEKQTSTVLLDLTRLSVWQYYYFNIYLIEAKGQQSRVARF